MPTDNRGQTTFLAARNVVGANNIDNAWEYNHRRLLKTETQLLPEWYFYSVTYEYDVNGNQTRTMTYDGLGRLKTVTSNMFGSTTGANYDYNALDNLTRVRIGGANARDHFYCYDAANRLTNLKTGSCSGGTVTGLGYGRLRGRR